jgi:hypothetical protein
MQVRMLNRKRVSINNGEGTINADLLLQEIAEDNEVNRLLPGSAAILVTVDITDRNSLGYADEILKYSANFPKEPVVTVMATKLDLKYEAIVWKDELEKLKSKYGVNYFIVSAKTGEALARHLNSLKSH